MVGDFIAAPQARIILTPGEMNAKAAAERGDKPKAVSKKATLKRIRSAYLAEQFLAGEKSPFTIESLTSFLRKGDF